MDPDTPAIRIRGARVHNLRDIDVDIPRGKLVVLTGVSGSGKSSLAFDTIYAEGRRRYIEGLSAYARQFLDQLERPDVDTIEGLPPTVAIDQKAGASSPRSTVGTVAEVNDYLRLLYARAGIPHCPKCDAAVRRQTPEQMVAGALGLPDGTKVMVMAPLVKGRKGTHVEAFEAIKRANLVRARVDGAIVDVSEETPKLAKTKVHHVEAVVDRLVVREGVRGRLAESVDLALKLGDGSVVLSIAEGEGWADRLLSVRHACPHCGTSFEAIEPRTFSFNSPYGACPMCDGLGVTSAFDPSLVAPDLSRSLAGGAIVALGALPESRRAELLEDGSLADLLDRHGANLDTPLKPMSARLRSALMDGDKSGFGGLLPLLDAAYRDAKTDARREALDAFRSEAPCPACGGSRLRPEARAVRIGGAAIHEVSALPIGRAVEALRAFAFEPPLDLVGPPLVAEVLGRLAYLERVGVGYLSLDRASDSLSGGELQRVRLAGQVGSGLVGACFVLDEPTAGLHPRDTERLLESLFALRDRGNSVVVVEHDEPTIRAADWVVDIGPGAGPDGGRVVAQGPPSALVVSGESSTAIYLSGHADSIIAEDRPLGEARIEVLGATEHNLKGDRAEFPIGALTVVSGVSGSGKSTLVQDVLSRAARRHLGETGPRPGAHLSIKGLEHIDKLVAIDQSPIGRSPRSTPATYTGLFDEIRKVYALTREARARGYKANRFSFNVKGGRCETCGGQGVRRVEMQFLPDLEVTCEACAGRRFNPPTLDCRFKGRSIADALAMRVDDALRLFEAVPKVRRGLESLREAGLGYVALGQSSTTLSGGEAQRVKLAAELGRASTGRTLYVLDEPTTGLHFADVAQLLTVLRRLAALGNTLVVIEHNLDVIRAADWVVDLGPEAGEGGGQVVAMGPPSAIAASTASRTGVYLR